MTTHDSVTDRLLVRPSDGERRVTLPGDDLVAADVVMDRAFTLSAPPGVVWPWLVQFGKHRAGWYLPRLVERAVPPSRRGLRHVEPTLQHLGVGDVVPDWGGAGATFTVVELEPGSHLLYSSTRGRVDLTWCLKTVPSGVDHTRVHLRLRLGPVRRRRTARHLGGLVDLATVAGLAAGLEERVTG